MSSNFPKSYIQIYMSINLSYTMNPGIEENGMFSVKITQWKNCFRITCNRLVPFPVGELHPAFLDYLGTGGGFSRLWSRKGSFIYLHKHVFIQSVCAWATSSPTSKDKINGLHALQKPHTSKFIFTKAQLNSLPSVKFPSVVHPWSPPYQIFGNTEKL